MTGFRDRFIKFSSKALHYIPSKWLLGITGQRRIIPFYHVISDEDLPHVKHLYPVKGVKAFEQDLDFILKMYDPIDYTGFQEIIKKRTPLKKPVFLLTFDDGLKEFHDVIAPILDKKGIPAICFLNSAFIDNRDMFYRYKASLLTEHLKNKPSVISDKKVLSWFAENFNSSREINSLLLSVSYKNRNLLDDFAELIQYDLEEYLSTCKPYLTSEQVETLVKKGFYFGAHSIDHPEYRYLSFEEQLRQTSESIEYIQNRFSLNYRIFSFPFTDHGLSKKFFEKVYHDNIADFTFGCAGQKKEEFQRHFQRVSFEMDELSAKEIYNSELIYFILKNILGKNKITRE